MEHSDKVFLFFVYGLASFAMGLTIVLELRRASPSNLSASLRFLAAFGLLHGLAQWVVMFHLVQTKGTTVDGSVGMRALFLAFSALAALALLQFGVRLIVDIKEENHWVQWLPWGLVVFWLVILVLPQASGASAAAFQASLPPAESCLECHTTSSGSYVAASRGWLTGIDIWSHYLLYLPGALLAAVGLAYQGAQFRARQMPRIARETNSAAAAFFVSALVVGVIVPPGPYPPASVVNYATVTEQIGFAPQILWVISAAAVAFFVVRLLEFFEIERQRQLEGVVVEERERIARELHDGLAQALGLLGLKASAAEELLDQGAIERVRAELTSMENAADEAYRDVRASILELRSTAVAERGLLRSLAEYGDKFKLETGIDVQFEFAEGVGNHFSPAAEIQIIRIVQEALANVRKHARATRATVRFERVGGLRVVTIADNGRGFTLADQAQRPGAHFGLQTMRERAESLGGRLRIETAPRQGTTIVVEIPCHSEGG